MKKHIHIIVSFIVFFVVHTTLDAQSSSSSAPYCNGNYTSGQCNQTGPSNSPSNSVNDFIDNFSTTGGNTNITNNGSGCNGNADNYINYCSNYLSVTPGQTIVATMQSGITFAQGFAIWVDWDQDNTFNTSTEYMGGTTGVPTAATPTTITFVIPATQPNGVYRMRVRCAFATTGPNITPCGTFGFGETEDYTIYVGPIPASAGIPSGTATVNGPICVGQALNFSVATTYTAPLSYVWSGPNSYSSTAQNPSLLNAAAVASGIYTVLITNSICPVTTTVQAVVVSFPAFTATTNVPSICQGGIFTASASLTNNPGLCNFSWTSNATYAGLMSTPNQNTTVIIPSLLPANVYQAAIVYSITISPTVHPVCSVTKTVSILVSNPPTPTLNSPSSICNTIQPVQLTALPSGGTWGGNVAVSAGGVFTPTAAAQGTINIVNYSVTIGNCMVSNKDTILVSRFISPALSSTVSTRCEQDAPFNLMTIVQNTLNGRWGGSYVINNHFIPTGLLSGTYSMVYNTKSYPDTTVCPGLTTMVIQVFNPVTPIIAPILPLCDNASTVILTASPQGGIWSGNSGVSSTGIRTPSLNSMGTNTVIYTAGQGTCVASSSATFHTSHYNTAGQSGVVPSLCVSSSPFNLMSIVFNSSGSWSGPNVSNGYFNPSGLPTNTYLATYNTQSSPDPFLCPDVSITTISVLNPATPVITQVAPLCSTAGSVQLSVSPPTGYWVSTSYLSPGGVFTPSLGSIGNNNVQYVIGTNTCNAQQTSTIKVEAFVSAALLSKIDDQCNTNPPVPLAPIVVNGGGYWSGPALTGSSFNPGISGAGTFTISYNTASYPSGLCPDHSVLSINVFSLAAPLITPVGPFCNSSLPVQLEVSPLGGIFGGGLPGAVSTSGVFNPAFGMIGENILNYTIAVGPCRADAQIKISVEAFVSADLAKPIGPIICINEEPFNLNSFVQNPGGTWGGDGVVGSMFYPKLANPGDNNLITYETHSTLNASLCRDTSMARIQVKNIPTVKAISSRYDGCAPLNIELNNQGTNKGIGKWNITDGSSYEGLTAIHTFTAPGNYTVVFTYTDDEVAGCSAQFVFPTPILVYETPKADFSYSPNEITIADPQVQLTNQSAVFASNKYVWTVQGEKNERTEIHPTVKFNAPGNYKVTLMATSVAGCTNQISKVIEVKNDFNVHIPNSFTPNFDGKNDVFIPVFTPYGLDAKSFELEIFDRWGHQVFHSIDVTKGWDGMIQGVTAKEGTYVYRIRFRDLEGRAYSRNGYVTLLLN
ncbi:hypothetical protein CNR22_07440 [Sphingobacteriaceae bacterium]|nr:hypothetical protein CNR22_07440 [Sphingobacteriaceae bacterium]